MSRGAFLTLLAGMALVGCSSGEFTDLDGFMAEQRARSGGAMEPIPPFKAYKAFSYSATSLRSPFDRPIEIREVTRLQAAASVEPDRDRPKEFLEKFTFDSLQMVGSLSRGGVDWTPIQDPEGSVDWTLIQDPEGGVHRVKAGNYLGRDHGKITETTDTYVAVIEIVPDGDEGWFKRHRTIKLNGL